MNFYDYYANTLNSSTKKKVKIMKVCIHTVQGLEKDPTHTYISILVNLNERQNLETYHLLSI